jgi:transcription-repair coupling factor (superfamily II helicase)
LGIRTIEAGPEGGSIDFKETTPVNPLNLVNLVQSDPRSYTLAGPNRLRFEHSLPTIAERQTYLEELLDNIATDPHKRAADA